MSENPYDEKHVRSEPWRCYARVGKAYGEPSMRNLVLGVSDGPEAFVKFDPDEPVDEFGENSLTRAVQETTSRMIEAALETEAGRWIEDHEVAYIVQGQTGKLTDGPTGAIRWLVKAFASAERAHDLLRTLNHWCCHKGVSRVAYEDPMRRMIIDPEGEIVRCPHDPGFRVDETGVLYTIVEVPLDMMNPIR